MAAAVTVSTVLSSSENDTDGSCEEDQPMQVTEETASKEESEQSESASGANSEDGSDGDDDDDDQEIKSSNIGEKGLANVLGKILKKSSQGNRGPILAKALTDRQRNETLKRKKGVEDRSDSKKPKQDGDSDSSEDEDIGRDEKRKLWEAMGRMKPHVMDKNKERSLQRIATRGIVQLFNAVRKQQKIIDEKITDVGKSETKRDKVMESMTKGKFMDVLKSTANVTTDSGNVPSKKSNKREESETPEEPSWSVLRDDFMMGAKMKDWDKEEDSSDAGDDGGGDIDDENFSSDES